MSAITFADLQALAIDTRDLPPMGNDRKRGVKQDPKRGHAARRNAKAMRQARTLKREAVLA